MVDNVGTDYVYAEATSAGGNQNNFRLDTTNYYSTLGNASTDEITPTHGSLNTSDHTYYMFSEIGSTTDDGDGTIGQRLKKDGRVFTATTDATYVSFTGNNSLARLSGSSGGGSDTNNINGRIGEVIAYAQNATQTKAETQRIESYMALKYGKTLSNVDTLTVINEGDYLLSDGTTVVWAGNLSGGVAAADAAFHSNVAGIGRDDVSDLDQRIARSINNDEIMSVALDNNFTVANSDTATRTTSWPTDKQWVMWGHQGGSLYFDTAVTTTNSNTRLGRYWKMKMTGLTTKSLNLQFGNTNVLRVKNGQQYVLLESTSATFGSPVELATASGVASGTTGSVTFPSVTITGGRYYTLATKMIAPGGVTAKLINGLKVSTFIDNTWTDSFDSTTSWYAGDTIALDNVGTGTSFGAPIMTAYVDHVQESQAGGAVANGGVTNGNANDNYVNEYNGYIVIPSTGSNYVFKLCGGTAGVCSTIVDDSAQMWIDKNNDGLLDDSERIINVVSAVGTSASQSLTAGNVKFRVRFKEVGATAFVRLTIASSSSPTIAEYELDSDDYRVEAPLAMWFKANQGAYDDYWTTKADLAVDADKVNFWENSALVPNNDLVSAATFVDGTGNTFNSATSANALNFNPTTTASADLRILTNADNGANDSNDFFGFTNGLSYMGGARTDFVVGMDPTVSGSEFFYSYGYNGSAEHTTFGREFTNGLVEVGQYSNNTVQSDQGVIVSNVPFSFSGTSAAPVAVTSAALADDSVQTVFGYGLQRDQATQNLNLNLGADTTLYELGDSKVTSGHNYNGNIAEVIHYPAQLSGTERYKVESYLAIKYGLTLSNVNVNGTESVTEGDYLSSAGTVIWDGNNGGVNGGIIGRMPGFPTTTPSASFSVGAQETLPHGVLFNNDGTKMYVLGGGATLGRITQYTLSTAYDITSATLGTIKLINAQSTLPQGFAFKPDGTKMYVIDSTNDQLFTYTLSTAFDVSTATYDATQSFPGASAFDTLPGGITFNNDGTKMFIVGDGDNAVDTFTLTTAYNPATAAFLSTYTILPELLPQDMAWNADGTYMYIIGSTGHLLIEYKLATAFDPTSAEAVQSIDLVGTDTLMSGITFKPDFTKMYVSTSTTADTVKQYNLAAAQSAGVNALYNNDIAIIGQDDASGLTQTKSKSQTKYGVITMGTPSALGDGDFLAIGSNAGQATTFISSGALDGIAPPTGYQRLDRAWKTQVTATPGTVKLEIDTEDTDLNLPNVTGPDGKLYLLLDSDVDGLFNDETPVQMYDDGTNGDTTASDNIWTRQTVTLVNNEVFTFAQQTPAGPG